MESDDEDNSPPSPKRARKCSTSVQKVKGKAVTKGKADKPKTKKPAPTKTLAQRKVPKRVNSKPNRKEKKVNNVQEEKLNKEAVTKREKDKATAEKPKQRKKRAQNKVLGPVNSKPTTKENKLKSYKCWECSATYEYPSMLLDHVLQWHTKPSLACSICPNVYSVNNELRAHERTKHHEIWAKRKSEKKAAGKQKKALFIENYRNRTVSQINRRNVKTWLGPHLYKCGPCNKEFILESSLRTHLATHNTTTNPKYGNPGISQYSEKSIPIGQYSNIKGISEGTCAYILERRETDPDWSSTLEAETLLFSPLEGHRYYQCYVMLSTSFDEIYVGTVGGDSFLPCQTWQLTKDKKFYQIRRGAQRDGNVKKSFHHVGSWLFTAPVEKLPDMLGLVEFSCHYVKVLLAMFNFVAPSKTLRVYNLVFRNCSFYNCSIEAVVENIVVDVQRGMDPIESGIPTNLSGYFSPEITYEWKPNTMPHPIIPHISPSILKRCRFFFQKFDQELFFDDVLAKRVRNQIRQYFPLPEITISTYACYVMVSADLKSVYIGTTDYIHVPCLIWKRNENGLHYTREGSLQDMKKNSIKFLHVGSHVFSTPADQYFYSGEIAENCKNYLHGVMKLQSQMSKNLADANAVTLFNTRGRGGLMHCDWNAVKEKLQQDVESGRDIVRLTPPLESFQWFDAKTHTHHWVPNTSEKEDAIGKMELYKDVMCPTKYIPQLQILTSGPFTLHGICSFFTMSEEEERKFMDFVKANPLEYYYRDYVQDAHSFWDWIYFVLLIVIGSFFMINLCLVVIATQFSETKKREMERMRIERARFTSSSTLTAPENASCYSEIVKLIAHLIRKWKRKARRQFGHNEENQIDLGLVRGNKDSFKIEQEGSPRPLTCPQLLAISGALGALPQVALGTSTVSGLPDWGELISTLRKAKPMSLSAPILTLTTPIDSPRNRNDYDHHQHGNNRDRSQSSSSSDLFSMSHRPTEEFGPCRSRIRDLVESKVFQQGILCAILINTFSMGVEHHNQPEWLTTLVEMCNLIFSGMFFVEMLLKLTAYGFVGYVSNGFDVFDGTIVILSAVEICQKLFSGDIHGAGGGGALSVLRTFRLLRILKLVRFLPNLRRQLVVMLKTMDNVAVFFGLLVLFIFIFSILGMNLFGCKFCAEATNFKGKLVKVCDRKNFDTLLWALVTVFQILTQEDWNVVLFNGMERTSPWAALYFVALMTFGNYVLFNLLVAILVEGFSSERIEREQKEREAELRAAARAAKALEYANDNPKALMESPPPGCSNNLRPSAPVIITHTAATPELCNNKNNQGSPHPPSVVGSVVNLNHINVNITIPMTNTQLSNSSLNSSCYLHPSQMDLANARMSPNSLSPYSLSPPSLSPQSLSPLPSPTRSPCLKRAKSWREEQNQRRKERRCSLSPNLKMNDHSNHNNNNVHASWCESRCGSIAGTPPSPSIVGSIKMTPFKVKCQDALQWLQERKEYSCFLFGPESRFRQRCHALVEHPAFDRFILFLIALNCITLAMERPSIPQDSGEKAFLLLSNDIFTVLFFFEMSVKVIAMGGFSQYFKSGWDVMDGCLVIINLIDKIISVFMSSPRIFGILRVFRLLRSLRPLRVINRAPGLKLVVQTLLSSLRPIGNIVLICCTFFIIFGILGVQLFKGRFFYCAGTAEGLRNVATKADCLSNGQKWTNQKYNFDDLGQALMSLFVLASKDGWVGIMYSGLDATEVDKQPQENFNEWRLLYFISFLLLVGFFVLNMFVGVVVENFHRCREEQEKEERVQRAAKRARKMEKRRRKMREPPYWSDYATWRVRIHGIVTSKYFDLAIAGVIGLNVVTMAMEFYMMPDELEYILKMFNYFFTSVFMLELTFKLIALGWKRYFRSKWNQLDIVIVALSIVGIVLEKMESDFIPINPTIMRVMRVLRIARVLKLLKMASGIRALLDTVVQALPQVGNLGLLFFLLFFIFSALGVELFGRLLCDDDFPCEGLGEHANFENFGMAFLTLFRVATGDNWNGIMKDTLREDCDPNPECLRNCCVSKLIAPLFFVVFVLMAQFVLVNVVVAVLMKHLEESHKAMEDDLDIDAELEAELAAQEEIMAKLVDDIQDTDDPDSDDAPKYIRLPKVTSLPNSFVFTYFEAE